MTEYDWNALEGRMREAVAAIQGVRDELSKARDEFRALDGIASQKAIEACNSTAALLEEQASGALSWVTYLREEEKRNAHP